MILVIDTTKREVIKLGFFAGEDLDEIEINTDDQSADILPAIDRALKSKGLSLEDIKGILVNRGPGSFTGVRVGIAVANSLAWSLNIPVVGYKEGELSSALKKIPQAKKFFQITLPYYDK